MERIAANKRQLRPVNRFHGSVDAVLDLRFIPGSAAVKETKRFTIKERDIGCRVSLHQHPFVQELTQRLLRQGTSGLLDADTDYDKSGASLPGSVELALEAGARLQLAGGSRVVLVSGLEATAGGVPIRLESGMAFRLPGTAPAAADLADGVKVTLADGLAPTPAAGDPVRLAGDREAWTAADVTVRIASPLTVTLHTGGQAVLPAGSSVLLPAGERFILPAGTEGVLLGSKPLPVLFDDFFKRKYNPNAELIERPYPAKELDFTASGAYSVYNWELFFHVPLTIAIHLSKNQRYAEAQRWFHYVFDPTDDSEGPTPERFWKVRPFQHTDVKKMEEMLLNLAAGADPALRDETVHAITSWREHPFRPHVIARYRHQAYMYKTVMAYLDNLIAWGDSLFRQDTGEAIDEALMLYLLAAQILGPRPQPVPKKGTVRPKTYANLRQDLKQFGTVLRDVEADLPFDLMPFPAEGPAGDERLATLRSLGQSLYFSIPRNDKLLGCWDTVADRLFKIRNSLNIHGIYRQLPLFEPPIDPGMLARAAAANVDVSAVVNGLNQPLPLVRFQWLIQKAAEIVQEVKTMGHSLLAAMEKEDGETLAILRAKHERVIMEMVESVRYTQLQEAIKSREGLQKTLALAIERYVYYEKQLGKPAQDIQKTIQEAVAALGELDQEGLRKGTFAMTEPELSVRDIEVDLAQDAFAQAAEEPGSGKLLSTYEALESGLLAGAQVLSDAASGLNTAASAASFVPQFEVSAKPWGVGGSTTFGGQNVASAINALSNAARGIADRLNFEARAVSRIDSFARREREWAFQSNLAAAEMNQIFRQLRAAQLREAIAEQELINHRKQISQAEEIERFLNEMGTEAGGKATNKALYAWMKREVKGLYAQYFQFAFDIAKKAERALQHELGDPGLSFIQYGYLSGKEGLLAGEKLQLDVKRMEMAYHELNRREYELTKHVGLLQLDPLALIQLRTTGRCTVRIPEALFDADCPGHYFRRIKTVAVSIPCVTGPYASVNCTLTLLKSSIRVKPLAGDAGYPRKDAEDDRFSDYYGSLQSIVTSSAQNDGGLFETDLRDQRYLPFEHAGVISEWQLQLPADPSRNEPCPFDYGTISDVILHIRYTAREGGEELRKAAMDHVKTLIGQAAFPGSVRLFSARHEFPTAWAKFRNGPAEPDKRHELALQFLPEHYPFWSRGRLNAVASVEVLAAGEMAGLDIFASEDRENGDKLAELAKTPQSHLLQGVLTGGVPAKPVGELKLYFETADLQDVWIAVAWHE